MPLREGQQPNGRFTFGNKIAKGNPLNRRAASLRAVCIQFMDRKKMWDLVEQLYKQAMEGDTMAAKELLVRTLGPPVALADPSNEKTPAFDPAAGYALLRTALAEDDIENEEAECQMA